MKNLLNLLYVLGISGALLAGCKATPPNRSQAEPVGTSSVVSKHDGDLGEDDSADESESDRTSDSFSSGSPESLAHFAAGISHALNDNSDAALNEFYQSASTDPTNEPIAIEVARTLLGKKQTQKAVDLLTKSAARTDSSSMVWCWLAQAQMQSGQTNQALNSARKAVQKGPESLEAYQALSSIQFQSGDFNGALATLDKARSNMQKSPVTLLGLAQLYANYIHERPDTNPAIKVRALALVDRVASARISDKLSMLVAQAYERLSEPGKAAETYVAIVKADPSPAHREKLAMLYLASGDKKRAAEQLQAIVRDNPTRFPRAWFMLGTLACDTKEFAGAAGFFEKAILLDPDMEQAYYDLALVQIDLKKNGEALDTLELARKKFPNTFLGEYFTGIAYTRLKNWPESVRHLTAAEVIAKASEPKQLDYQFYFHLGAAAERNHQLSDAAQYFEISLKLKPDFVEAMNYLGYMWAERGENLGRAKELIEKAVKAQPTNAAYLDSLGWVLFKQGKPADALPLLMKSCDLSDEPDATLFEHVGDVYQALGNKDKAREAWKKSLKIETNDAIQKKLNALPGASP